MDLEQRAFALRHLYTYPRLKLAYTYIPKNACTSFKRTFGRAQGWLAGEKPPAHEMTMAWWLSGLARYPLTQERIVVVRDPFDRVLSAYLNKFLARRETIADNAMTDGLGAVVGEGSTRADVTFAHFVEYLSRTPSRRLNEHWRPQNDFLVGSYTRLVRFDRIAEDTAFLAERGLTLDRATGHGTTAVRVDLGPGWGDRPAGRLRRMRRTRGLLPTGENLYDDRLRAQVADRFAEDIELFTRCR